MEYENEGNKLYFVSLLSPARFLGYKSTTILGANIEESMIYQGWSDQGIEFAPHPKITRRLRYTAYTQGVRFDIRYLQAEADSKYSHKKVVNGRSRIEQHNEAAKKFFAGKDWLYVANTDQPDLEEAPGAKRMPVIANGRNDYDGYDNIYFSAALNRTPMWLNMLYTLGFDPRYVTRASMHETIHQAIMRTSLRRPDSTSKVTGLVVDMPSGEAMARLFPQSTLGPLNGVARRVKPIPLSATDRNRNSRVSSLLAAKGLQKYYLHAVGDDSTENGDDYPFLKRELSSFSVSTIQVTELADIHTTQITQLPTSDGSLMEFKAMLRALSGEVIRAKNQYRLFNTTVFDEPGAEDTHVRGLAQALYSHLMILDIDDGDLSPAGFVEILSPYQIAFSICNSFSRAPEHPNKFRVFIYLKSPVDDHDYKRIWDSIVRVFASAGYYTDVPSVEKKRKETYPAYMRTGIDRSKRHIASFYYPPCINIEHRDMAFFESHNCERARDMAKHALDPVKWLKQHPEPTPLAPIEFEEVLEELVRPTISHLTAQERIDRAIIDYNDLTEGRHYGGYLLVLRILAADPDESRLRRHLGRARNFNYQKLSGRVSDAKRWLSRSPVINTHG